MATKKNRTCAHCGDPIPEDAGNRRKYCTSRCQRDFNIAKNRLGPKKYDDRDCEQCGRNYTPTVNWQKYCTRRCSIKAQNRKRTALGAAVEGQEDYEPAIRPRVKHPVNFVPGYQLKGNKGTVVSKPIEDQYDPNDETTDWQWLLEQWGLSPEKYAIDGDTVEMRSWDAAVGDGRVETMYYYKAKIVLRTDTQVSYQDLVDEFKNYTPPEIVKPASDGYAFLVFLSDWQIGKGDYDGTKGTINRILEMQHAVKARYEELRKIGRGLDTLGVFGMGDIVEACYGMYPHQPFTVELNNRDQVKYSVRLLRDSYKLWVPDFTEVKSSAVGGNHGEHRTRSGSKLTDDADNRDVMVFERVAEILAENPHYDHIKWNIPDDDLAITVDVGDTVIGLTHSHLAEKSQGSSGPLPQGKVREWWKSQSFGRTPIGDADILVTGHFHHGSFIDHGPKVHFQCPTMDGGSKYWTERNGSHSKSGTLTLVVRDGVWQDMAII